MKFEAEIRGMHFRISDPINPSPAKLLIELLPSGAGLSLVREPENAYDSNAIQVWLPRESLPSGLLGEGPDGEDFELKLNGYGWTREMVADAPELMLGFVGKEFAEHIAPKLDAGEEPSSSFFVSGKGKPMVKVEFE